MVSAPNTRKGGGASLCDGQGSTHAAGFERAFAKEGTEDVSKQRRYLLS